MNTVLQAPTKGEAMTVTLDRGGGRRCGLQARLLTLGVLACGAVLLPATGAVAQDMPDMKDGMLCPHALGDASNPATAAPPSRTSPNEAPLAAKPASVTQASPARPATKPASKAPAQRAAARTPASAPATTTAKSQAGAGAAARAVRQKQAVVAQPQRAVTTVVQPQRHVNQRPRRTTPKHTAPARRASTPTVTTTVIPEVTRPSAGSAPRATATATGTPSADITWLAIGGALIFGAFAVAIIVLRRRGSSGPAVAAATTGPLEPSVLRHRPPEVDEVELALREMLAEARAWELLDNGERGEAADREVSIAPR